MLSFPIVLAEGQPCVVLRLPSMLRCAFEFLSMSWINLTQDLPRIDVGDFHLTAAEVLAAQDENAKAQSLNR